jgi:hypothetical protein
MLSVRNGLGIRPIETVTCAGKAICTVAGLLLLASLSLAGQKAQPPSKTKPAGPFDTPIKKVTVDFGPSTEPEKTHVLDCYYYPHLLVKEYALYGIGTDWLSMLRSRDTLPACKRSHEPGERIIKYPEWDGFFKGVKDHLVFFDDANPFNGGYAFVIYDSVTGRKLFEDSAYYENDSSRLRVFSTKAGYVLRYLRVANVDCNLHADEKPCWKKVKAKLALETDKMPVCTDYDHIAEVLGTDKVESRVAYPVEVTLSAHPFIRTVAGPVKCWPQQ